jgi:uncharacterized protein (TIGR00730 family)
MKIQKKEIQKNDVVVEPMKKEQLENIIKIREKIIAKELDEGFNLIKKYPRTISIFGSARASEDSKYYKQARSLAYRIAKELKYAIVTGGGPGIMEAANRGAYEAGGISIGFTIKLPKEQARNKYLTEYVDFDYFYDRKALLFFSAESYVFFPGGFGTFDELFSTITSIQTKKINRTPVILVGKEFWTPFLDLMRQKLFGEISAINKEDLFICDVVDSEDEIIKIIKNAPFKQEE